jgi:CheY-like chemotaxis protein
MAKKILLADDSITIQKVVELTFSDGDYEIVAVNNGAKAIQKLQEMRPDIILSDIIMPEKNGYEVCEFVKSHPDFKTIPVILLTGTFEPFDPDRAERAGCDAVVTKPFESQSLIHKVDELIGQSAGAATPAPEIAEASPFDETHNTHRPEAAASSPAAEDEPFAEPAQPSPEEIFGVAPGAGEPQPPAPADRSGSVFDETNPPRPEPDAGPPTDEPEATAEEPAAASGETMSLHDVQQQTEAPAAQEPPAQEPDSSWSAATTAFPKMSFADLQRMREETAAPPPAAPEEPPAEPQVSAEPQLEWPRPSRPAAEESPLEGAPEPTAPAGGFGFDVPHEEPKGVPFEPPPAPGFSEASPDPEPESPSAYSAETTAFPKMTFEDLQRMRDETSPPPVEELPWTSSPEPLIGGAETQEDAPQAEAPDSQLEPAPAPEAAPLPSAESPRSLSDEEIDRIARRVVELMSEKAVRDIAWEVIPDLAQSIVRERIRELEAEA